MRALELLPSKTSYFYPCSPTGRLGWIEIKLQLGTHITLELICISNIEDRVFIKLLPCNSFFWPVF